MSKDYLTGCCRVRGLLDRVLSCSRTTRQGVVVFKDYYTGCCRVQELLDMIFSRSRTTRQRVVVFKDDYRHGVVVFKDF